MDPRPINALFIDDEQAFLDVLTKRLERRGINTLAVNSGKAGLSELYLQPFDVVVLDVCMPGMDGISVLRAVKENWPMTEVILLTGHACLDAARQGMTQGAFDYMMKPVDIDELVFKLEDAYDKVKFLKQRLRRNKGGD